MKRIISTLIVIALFAMGVFAAGCTTTKTGQTTADIPNGLGKAPDFTVTTITGETVSMQSYLVNGKPTLVYFMASWCPTCAKNWPSLNKIYTEYGNRVNLVAISIDPTDTKEVLTKLSSDKGLIFPIVSGNPQLMVDFGVKGQATTVGIDKNGNIVFIKSGEFSLNEYKSLVEGLLAK